METWDICCRNGLCGRGAESVPELNHVVSNLPYYGVGVGFCLLLFIPGGTSGGGIPVRCTVCFATLICSCRLTVPNCLEGLKKWSTYIASLKHRRHMERFLISNNVFLV